MPEKKIETVDQYIAQFPEDVREILEKIRRRISCMVPEAAEKISWGMPTFYLYGNLVHFAAMKHHIGFYPGADAVIAFSDKILPYKSSKGAIQFPLNQPIPYELIEEIVLFRIEQQNRIFNEKELQKNLQKRKGR